MPPTDTPTPERALAEMTLEELRAERDYWMRASTDATEFLKALHASQRADACKREIARRSASAK